MKKLIALLLAAVLVMSLVACGNTTGNTNTTTEANGAEGTVGAEGTEGTAGAEGTEGTAGVEGPAATEGTAGIEGTVGAEGTEGTVATPVIEPNAATQVLTNIWNAVAEDSRFFSMGGDMENMVDNAPGNFGLTDVEALTATLHVPADQVANIACASSLMHGMLANNFTAGLYQIKEGSATSEFASAMLDAINGAQWICGMPETLLIVGIEGEYVLVVFGINDAINPFRTALQTAYPDAEIVVDEPIAG